MLFLNGRNDRKEQVRCRREDRLRRRRRSWRLLAGLQTQLRKDREGGHRVMDVGPGGVVVEGVGVVVVVGGQPGVPVGWDRLVTKPGLVVM